jgi:hypothetical protein
MQNDSLPTTVAPSSLDGVAGVAAGPTVYLSACGQDTAAVAAVVKARLESQGCLVRHGGVEVRNRSQCARHYGPLLHDCDVFIQLIGVDPGPLLSSDDGDDDFWSLQVWEAREAARRKKPARHYLLHDDFCRTLLTATARPNVLKKQERHRRKLAGSPKKVRQVRDADELLRVLPIIRLAGDVRENQPIVAVTGFPEGVLKVTEVSRESVTPDVRCFTTSPVALPLDVPAVAESKMEGPPALMPVVQIPAIQESSPGVKEAVVFDIAVPRETHSLPELPFLPDIRRADDAGSRREFGQSAESSRFASPETLLPPTEPAKRNPSGEPVPDAGAGAARLEMEPIPTVPALPAGRFVPQRPDVLLVPAPATTPTKSEIEVETEKPSEVVAKETSVVVPTATPPTLVPDTSVRDEGKAADELHALPCAQASENTSNKLSAPDLDEASASDTVAGKKAFADKRHVHSLEVDSERIEISLGDDTEIEARAPWRIEIVAQTPMKLELCRAEGGQRVSLRPFALERRGLPKRGRPTWMLKRSADHTAAVRPVPGRRAFAKPLTSDEADGPADKAELPFLETLILPNKTSMRRYLRRRFIIFRLTDSVTVRRLSEVSTRKPGIVIAVGALGVVLLGLLVTASAWYFFDSGSLTPVAVASGSTSELAAPSRLDISAPARNPNVAEQDKPTVPKDADSALASAPSPAPEPQKDLPVAVVGAKAGSTSPSSPEIEIKPAVIPSGNLDEQQKAWESALEHAILTMRKSDAGAEVYALKNETSILELQRGIQELIPIRNGHEFSGSAQSLALSRSLASVHLLGGRRQAARNVLLDLRETIGATRTEGDPEIRLADHLLRLAEYAPPASKDSSARPLLPLTPGEIAVLLAKFGADPQWEPPVSNAVAGGSAP